MGPEYQELKALVRREGLHTVCEEAGCPNIFECWEDREATFLIGGEQCTRRCDFCQIDTGKPAELDRDEPRRVAESVQAMGLRYSTVTGVARDDLPDGGAWLYAEIRRPPRPRRWPIGRQQAAQQIHPVLVGQCQPLPEPRPEGLQARVHEAARPQGPFRDPVGEQPQDARVRPRVGDPEQHAGQQMGGPPAAVHGPRGGYAGRGGGRHRHQLRQPEGQLHRALAPSEQQQRLDGRPGAVSGDGEQIEVHMGALQPLRELLVREAVSAAGRDQQPLGQHRGGPAGLPREDLLEGRTVQRARPGAESAAGRLVHLAGDLGGQPAHGGAAQRGTVRGREPYGDAQAHQVQVGVEDLVAVGRAEAARIVPPSGLVPLGERRADLREQAQGQRVAGVRRGRCAGRQAVAATGALRRFLGEVTELHTGGQRGRRTARPVQQAGRESAPARSQYSGRQAITSRTPAVRSQSAVASVHPASRSRRARADGISSGPSSSTSSGRPAADAARATPCEVVSAGSPAVRPAPATVRPADRSARSTAVRTPSSSDRSSAPRSQTVGAGFGPCARRAASPASSVLRPVPGSPTSASTRAPALSWRSPKRANSATASGRSTGSRHSRRPLGGAHRHLGEMPRTGRIQFTAVGRDGRRIALQQRGQRALGRGLGDRAQRNREAARPASERALPRSGAAGRLGMQRGAEDAEHGARPGVQHRPADRGTAQPQRLPAPGAQSELQRFVEEMDALGGRVHHPGARPDDRAVQPAARPEPCGGARGRPADGDRQRREPVRPEAAGPYEGEPGLRKGRDRVGRHHAGPSAAPGRAAAGAVRHGLQHQLCRPVHRFVAGDHGALVVREEPRTTRPTCQIADPHQCRVHIGIQQCHRRSSHPVPSSER